MRSRIFARAGGQGFQHLLHNLRLQLRHLRLQGLRHGVFDYLPHFILFFVPHA